MTGRTAVIGSELLRWPSQAIIPALAFIHNPNKTKKLRGEMACISISGKNCFPNFSL